MKAIRKLIDDYTDRMEEKEDLLIFRGFCCYEGVFNKACESLNTEVLENNGYLVVFANEENKTILTYCEGDIIITVCETADSYTKEKQRNIDFIKEARHV